LSYESNSPILPYFASRGNFSRSQELILSEVVGSGFSESKFFSIISSTSLVFVTSSIKCRRLGKPARVSINKI